MLKEKGVTFDYREYTEDPLSEAELRAVLAKLGMGPHDLLRGRDAKALGIDGAALDDDRLIAQMAKHPTLVQRPIAVLGERAVVGRPHERILEVLA